MWKNTKYELPQMRLEPCYRYESAPVLICIDDVLYVAKLTQDEEKDNPPVWQMAGPDAYTYASTVVSHWQHLPMKPTKNRVCGNATCGASSGIWEDHTADGSASHPWALTFGRGALSPEGIWEFPCRSCAREAEERDNVPRNSYWPREPKEDACIDG